MQFFDSHAHVSSLDVWPKIEAVLTRARIAGVQNILNICTDPQTLFYGLELATKESCIRNAGATTPHDVEAEGEEAFPIFQKAAREGKLAAVGETGLDYHYAHSDRKLQQRFLEKYLELALECKLPVIFHCREAFQDLFAITDLVYRKGAPAILHCFTGTVEEAKAVLDRGWYLSLSGIVTFKKSAALREVAKMVPLEQLLIETDTPYLAPQSKRGQPNEPAYLPETAACIAAAKGLPLEMVAEATYQNGYNLFFS